MSIDTRIVLLTCGFGFLYGCEKNNHKLFTKLDKENTHISFINEIIETKELNVMQYEYLYNGGGVGIGDFNGDTLPDIYFTGNMVKNKLYLNQGNFEFVDITAASDVAGKKAWASGVSVADVNGDGLLDIYVCYSGLGDMEMRSNQLFINQGNNDQNIPTFVDRAKEYGVDAPGSFTTQAAFFDYDRDGDLDLFLLNHSKTFYSPFFNSEKLRNTRHPYFGNRLYRNDTPLSPLEGRERVVFTDVSEQAGIHGSGLNFGLGITVSDFNLDGYPDIYVSNDYEEQDFLYINLKNGQFQDRSHQSLGHISKFSMGNDAADLNNDGLVDLLTLDMLPEDNYRQKLLKGPDDFDHYQLALDNGYHHQQMRNMLHYNRGIDTNSDPVFSEIGQLSGVYATDWSWAVLLADYDNDANKDIFITNGYLRDFTNMDFVKFHVDEAVKKERSSGKELFDEKGKREHEDIIFNLVKKIPSTKISNYAFRNRGGLHFENVSSKWGLDDLNVSTGAAYADLDLDGDLDLIVTLINESPAIYRNENISKTSNDFVRIRLHGNRSNTYAIGAKVWLETDSSSQLIENFPVRGYQSSVDPILHFGLGQAFPKLIKIIWPNGEVTLDDNPKSGTLIHYYQKDTTLTESEFKLQERGDPFLKDITASSSIRYSHVENEFVDFKVDRLALKQFSKSGPRMSIGDLNSDGFDDVFIGGASGQADVVFLSQKDGSFLRSKQPAFEVNKSCETTGSGFFDADNDGDLDIYAVSGGTDFRIGSMELKDVLYLNDGNGLFSEAKKGAIPIEFSNGSCVTAGDFDNDGDEDLFVGGSSISGNFPMGSPGGILINESDRAKGIKFTLGTELINEQLREPGIVNDAKWVDINNDHFPDLILAGEWMPIRIFINENGKKLVERTDQMNLGRTAGLWQRIEAADIDGDGDTDFIVGNIGKNLPFDISSEQPLTVYAIDYYGNGEITPIICSYVQNKSYPIASLDEIQNALPVLKKKFRKYEAYAGAAIEDIFAQDILERSKVYHVNQLESAFLINDGNGSFGLEILPGEAQLSAIQGIVFADLNEDEIADILLAGNLYPLRAQYGPSDASIGTLLIGLGNGQYRTASQKELGVWIRGDVRDAKLVKTLSSRKIIVTKNSENIQVLQTKNLSKPISKF